MAKFSNDVDLLKYEPALFGDLYLAWQILIARSGGTLSGTTFTASGADFIAASVTAGHVIYLQSEIGPIDGAYEIVSVDSATQLTVSVVRSSSDDDPIAPPTASNISFRICTYDPQAVEAAFQITQYLGIAPGKPSSELSSDDVLYPESLKIVSVFAILASIYATLASSTEDENLWEKGRYYQVLYEKEKSKLRVSVGDSVKDGSTGKLKRE